MLRYVILYHQTPPDSPRPTHWDLMFERGEQLRSWALKKELCGEIEISAEVLPDHRLDYLDYEGPISENRGTVTRWDQGTYRTEEENDERLVVCLQGTRQQGRLILQRIDPQFWTVLFRSD